MNTWWAELTTLNKTFYCAAAFFGVLFIWQILSAFIGLGGDDADADVDADVDGDVDGDFDHDVDHDATYDHFEDGAEGAVAEGLVSFRLLGVRSVITFFTLFTWGTAMYLNNGENWSWAMGYSIIWGVAGGFLVALIFFWMQKLTETGNMRIASAVGTRGAVYLDIPSDGTGEVRATVSGVVAYLKARSSDGKAIKAGAPVQILRKLGPNTVEVKVVQRAAEKGKE